MRAPRRLLALAALAVAGLVVVPAASAKTRATESTLTKAVTVNGVLAHERALQSIANLNDGIRAAGTPGYDASVRYVAGKLRKAGYRVKTQPFPFAFFQNTADPVLERVSPNPKAYTSDDFGTLQYSGSGDVMGTVVPTNDIQVPPPAEPGSTSGCEPSDFPPETSGNVALVQRGTCDFAVKAQNAQDAGAAAVIIFNEGQPGRQDNLGNSATLGGTGFTIPVLGTSFATGAELYNGALAGDVTVHAAASTVSETREAKNILATTKGGDPDKLVVVGSHLDSVTEGPGINDNGSGSATDLEIALQMKKLHIKPKRKLRFAFWGAEEEGLIGSQYYVDHLSPNQVAKHYANLNYDMLGSPNYARLVYDGDGSDTDAAGPPGSPEIEALFNAFFARRGQATDPTAFDGRSDYGPFIDVGIPAGGLFSGAEEIKSPEQAAKYGGTAGVAFDSCYHQACDTANNLNSKALSELGDGDAYAVFRLAMSSKDLFGEPSVRAKAKAERLGKARAKRRLGTHELR